MGAFEVAAVDDEYAKLIRRMNPPRVVIDNDACDIATVIRVASVNRQGILLEVVQVLADLDLVVIKAYISLDGEWFMDVFNVVDHEGNKILDKETVHYIKETIEKEACNSYRGSVFPTHPKTYNSIELIGTDRPGLLSEVCAVLAGQMCNVLRAEFWTHNSRSAGIVHVAEGSTGLAIEDLQRLSSIKELLCNVLNGGGRFTGGKASVGIAHTHTERRLHQLLFDDKDYERAGKKGSGEGNISRPNVVLLDCFERDYTIAILRSKDRPKLIYDTICALTDMQYVVFHGMVDTSTEEAYQEYYIRHVDGFPIHSECERQHVILCLEAALERRSSEGLELELRTKDRIGLLSEITKIFRENGLRVQMAKISTKGVEAVDTFYVSDICGGYVGEETINSIQKQIGESNLRVKHNPHPPPKTKTYTAGFLLGTFLKVCALPSFSLIRSCS